jgi:hypothetical protein
MNVSCRDVRLRSKQTIEGGQIMLEKRYVAGKWIYRVPGALVWTYSRTDAIEQAKQGTQDRSQSFYVFPSNRSGS